VVADAKDSYLSGSLDLATDVFFNESNEQSWLFTLSKHPPRTLAPKTAPSTRIGRSHWEGFRMEPTNRRDFLKHASVAAAVAGAAAAVPLSITESASAEEKTPRVPADAHVEGHVVAHLRDVQTGEVAIYSGNREITVKDKRLAALIYKASR
jgi:hypothetical protein